MRKEISVYRQIASAASRGSKEQIVATRLAAQGEARLARSLGVTRTEQKSLSASVARTDRALGRAGRGALAGSGAFRSFGRSLAFASAYFLSFAAGARLVRSSISAAVDLQRQTERTSILFGSSATIIRGWAKTTANSLGLARGESLKAAADFGTMFRGFGVGSKVAAQFSKSLVARAADLASFRNVDFGSVASAFQKGLGGMGRGLKVFGIDLTAIRLKAEALRLGLIKGAVDMHKVGRAQNEIAISAAKLAQAQQTYGKNSVQAVSAGDRLSAAQDKLAGLLKGKVPASLTSAQKALAAYAIEMHDTALEHGFFAKHAGQLSEEQKRLKALLTNVREELGTALLPTVLKYTRSLVDWLSKSKNQATILRDVKSAVHILTEGISAAVAVLRPMARAAELVAKAVGGWKHAFELILSGYLAFKFLKVARAIKECQLAMLVFGSASKTSVVSNAAMMAGALNSPLGKVGKLRLALMGLKTIGVITIAIGISEFLAKKLGVPGPLEDQVRTPGKKPPGFETKGMKPLAGGWYKSGSHFLHWNPESGKWDKDTTTQPVSALGSGRLTSGGTPGHFGGPVSSPRPSAATIRESAEATDAAKRAAAEAARRRRLRLEALRQARPFALPMSLQLQQAKAEAVNSQKQILAAAHAIRAFILKALPHLKGTRLLEAYGMLASANDTIASAVQEAAAKAKAQADAARQKLAAARQAMAQAVENIRSQVGELFQGPILAPTDQQMKAKLGVRGPKASDLTKDLKAQTALYARFNRDLAILARRGAPKELLKELRAKGPSDIQYIESLAKANRKDLREFFKVFGKRERLVQRVAKVEMRAAQVTIRAARLTLEHLGHGGPAPRHHRIRHMAEGGIAVGPTLALIGERGPEAVVPLSRAGGSDSRPIHTHVYLNDREIATAVTTRQQRATKTMAPQVRGRHPGHILGTS